MCRHKAEPTRNFQKKPPKKISHNPSRRCPAQVCFRISKVAHRSSPLFQHCHAVTCQGVAITGRYFSGERVCFPQCPVSAPPSVHFNFVHFNTVDHRLPSGFPLVSIAVLAPSASQYRLQLFPKALAQPPRVGPPKSHSTITCLNKCHSFIFTFLFLLPSATHCSRVNVLSSVHHCSELPSVRGCFGSNTPRTRTHCAERHKIAKTTAFYKFYFSKPVVAFGFT